MFATTRPSPFSATTTLNFAAHGLSLSLTVADSKDQRSNSSRSTGAKPFASNADAI